MMIIYSEDDYSEDSRDKVLQGVGGVFTVEDVDDDDDDDFDDDDEDAFNRLIGHPQQSPQIDNSAVPTPIVQPRTPNPRIRDLNSTATSSLPKIISIKRTMLSDEENEDEKEIPVRKAKTPLRRSQRLAEGLHRGKLRPKNKMLTPKSSSNQAFRSGLS